MKIKYLGTAAAEGIPALFCECDYCKKVRVLKGKNIRTRSQTLINDDLLIDFGPDTYQHVIKYNIELGKIKNLLITHSHSDHLYKEDIYMRYEPYAHLDCETTLNIYATETAVTKIYSRIGKKINDENISRIRVNNVYPFKPFATENGYEIIALEANHKQFTSPVIYSISDGNKHILYAHDTGYFTKATWDYIEANKLYFDMISLDCTSMNEYSDNDKCDNHMNLTTNFNVCDKLAHMGAIDDSTVRVVNHFSHNGKMTYDELVEFLDGKNFVVSYDGLEISL